MSWQRVDPPILATQWATVDELLCLLTDWKNCNFLTLESTLNIDLYHVIYIFHIYIYMSKSLLVAYINV